MSDGAARFELRGFGAAMFDACASAVVVLDARGIIVARNARFDALFEPAVGASIDALWTNAREQLGADALRARIACGEAGVAQTVISARTRDGAVSAYEWSVGVFEWDHARYGVIELRDASARAQVEARLHHASTHDALTGLSNRAALEELRASLDQSAQRFAVVIADVDGLKAVNDRHGHELGDALIVAAADAMRAASVASDTVIARLGGDEFALLLMDADAQALGAAIEAIRAAVTQRASEPAAEPALSLSVGGALRAGSEPLARTMRRADEAMYSDKRTRRGASARR